MYVQSLMVMKFNRDQQNLKSQTKINAVHIFTYFLKKNILPISFFQ